MAETPSRQRTLLSGEMTESDDESPGVVEVPVTVLGQGESIATRLQLHPTKIDSIASLLAMPRESRRARLGLFDQADDIRFLASRLGVSRGDIKRSLRDKRVLERVLEQATAAAILLAPDMVYEGYKIAMDPEVSVRDRLPAMKLVLGVGGLAKEKGPQVNVQNNVNVGVQVNEQAGQDPTISEDAMLKEQVEALRADGLLGRFLGLPQGDTGEAGEGTNGQAVEVLHARPEGPRQLP